jgi:hypothetical protein
MTIINSLYDKHTFANSREWSVFEQALQDVVVRGFVEEIDPLSKTISPHERWFRDRNSGEVYRYVEPEPGVGDGVWMEVSPTELG